LQHRDKDDTALANYTFTYDLSDRLTSETRNGTVLTTYAYNATNELTRDGAATFRYALSGNRTKVVENPLQVVALRQVVGLVAGQFAGDAFKLVTVGELMPLRRPAV
jgi:YD repeat-containing protein